MNKKVARIRRAKRARMHIRKLGRVRLCINRTPRHIYAQIISSDGGTVIASASTVEKTFRGALKNGGNVEAAAAVGKLVAERAREAGVDNVAFDRGGFKFHGRVKALADAARENGLTI